MTKVKYKGESNSETILPWNSEMDLEEGLQDLDFVVYCQFKDGAHALIAKCARSGIAVDIANSMSHIPGLFRTYFVFSLSTKTLTYQIHPALCIMK